MYRRRLRDAQETTATSPPDALSPAGSPLTEDKEPLFMATPNPHECYPAPRHTTAKGRRRFDELVQGYARTLAEELNHRAVPDVNAGREPEQTATSVENAAREMTYTGTGSRSRGRTVSGRLLITTATAGPPIVVGLLAQSLPIILTSCGFAVALLIGLWLLRPIRTSH